MIEIQIKRFVKVPSAGVVRMEGPDGLDLLQRISTNDLSKLQNSGYQHTILTTEKGKIVDIITVSRASSSDLLLVPWSGQSSTARAWIEKFIIMEDAGVKEEMSLCCYAEFGGGGLGTAEQGDWISYDNLIGLAGFRNYICPIESEEALRQVLARKGEQEARVDDLEEFCIRMGIPQWPHEISADVNPLEAGLDALISWTKGCYVGQEVIARLDTYKKVQKHLIGFELDKRPAGLPAPIMADGSVVGTLTRVTRDAPFVGLGYVHTGHESSPLSITGDEVIALRKRS